MCSLGSRLQSARVISSPSKNLRLETLTSSMLLWSISSGSGERRYSSSFCSVFSSPRSRAAMRPTINVVKTLKTKSFSSLCFQYEQIIHFFFLLFFSFLLTLLEVSLPQLSYIHPPHEGSISSRDESFVCMDNYEFMNTN